MTRLLFLIHRYLGIALSLAIVLWCASGLVMMYVQYPVLTEEEQVRGLAELAAADCCVWPADFSNIEVERFDVEMLGGRPAVRLRSAFGEYALDLRQGRYVESFDEAQARDLAADAARQLGIGEHVRSLGAIERDQWTVGGGYDLHRPLYRFAADDARGTELYVSSSTGAIVLWTTARERYWNWLGSVIHWFYPTVIRQHVEAWSQTIIATTILGIFLTVVGLSIGVKQLKRRRSGRLSPYRGLRLWHHYAGLCFGILTLTWLFSGLMSLNPWGALVSRSFAAERSRVHGEPMRLEHAQAALADIAKASLPAGTTRLVGEMFAGRVYLTAWTATGERVRLDGATLAPAALTETELAAAAARLRPGVPILDQGWLRQDDAYYYSHHDERRLPVYRVRYADLERLYLDAVTGQLTYAVDTNRRSSRWLFLALHRGDFAAAVRERPFWDLMMWALMAGVTVGGATGAWLAVERIARALRRLSYRRANSQPS